MPVLFEKSGAEGEYRRFKFELLKLADKNALPGYDLSIEATRAGEPLLRMRRIDGKDGAGKSTDIAAAPSTPAASPTPEPNATGPIKPVRQEHPPALTGEATIDARRLIRSTIAGLSQAATRGFMTDETITHLRETCPGWDLHALHAEFEAWVGEDQSRTPVDWQRAFIGFVRRHHARHGASLRR